MGAAEKQAHAPNGGRGRGAEERLIGLVFLFASARRPLATTAIISDSDLGYGSPNRASDLRKFRRDRESLQHLGFIVREIPARSGAQNEESSWELDRAATYAQLPALSVDELLTLIHGIEMHLARPLLPYRADLSRAAEKLKALCAARFPSAVDAAASAGGKDAGPALREARPLRIALGILWNAWQQRKAVSLRYRNARGATSKRLVALYGMFTDHGLLYLVGADLSKDGHPVRTFRADRIVAAGRPSAPYRIPPDFSVDAYRFFSFSLGQDKTQAVTFSFPDTLPQAELQRITHGTGALQREKDHVLWTVPARSLPRAAAYGFEHASRGMRPVAPAALVKHWNDTLAKVVSAYDRANA